MKKKLLVLAALAVTMVGCGRIHTANVGLRTDFNGTVSSQTLSEGFYTAITSSVDEYSGKEIAIELTDLTPKAKDNLSLKDLDVTVYYQVNRDKVRELAIKRTGQSAKAQNENVWFPAYYLVRGVAISEIGTAVSKVDSLEMHKNFEQLGSGVKAALQASLDKTDPATFTITRVVIHRAVTDPTIEQSIRNVVAKEKELEAATLNVKVAQANAEANQKTALTLTPQFLQHEYNQVMKAAFESGKVGTIVMDGSASGKILNLK